MIQNLHYISFIQMPKELLIANCFFLTFFDSNVRPKTLATVNIAQLQRWLHHVDADRHHVDADRHHVYQHTEILELTLGDKKVQYDFTY